MPPDRHRPRDHAGPPVRIPFLFALPRRPADASYPHPPRTTSPVDTLVAPLKPRSETTSADSYAPLHAITPPLDLHDGNLASPSSTAHYAPLPTLIPHPSLPARPLYSPPSMFPPRAIISNPPEPANAALPEVLHTDEAEEFLESIARQITYKERRALKRGHANLPIQPCELLLVLSASARDSQDIQDQIPTALHSHAQFATALTFNAPRLNIPAHRQHIEHWWQEGGQPQNVVMTMAFHKGIPSSLIMATRLKMLTIHSLPKVSELNDLEHANDETRTWLATQISQIDTIFSWKSSEWGPHLLAYLGIGPVTMHEVDDMVGEPATTTDSVLQIVNGAYGQWTPSAEFLDPTKKHMVKSTQLKVWILAAAAHEGKIRTA